MVPLNGYTWFSLGKSSGRAVKLESGGVSLHRAGRGSRHEREARRAVTERVGHASVMVPAPPTQLIDAAISRKEDVYFLRGRNVGAARLRVAGRRTSDVLDVSVHQSVVLPTALNLVRHKPTGSGAPQPHSDAWSLGFLRSAGRIARDILAPQTNVVLKISVRYLDYDGDLGPSVEYPDPNPDPKHTPDPEMRKRDEVRKLIALRDGRAKMNVYFVGGAHEMSQTVGASGGSGGAFHYSLDRGNIVVTSGLRGSAWRCGGALAHEACHAIGIKSHTADGLFRGGAFNNPEETVTHWSFKLWRPETETIYRAALAW